ncbi:MAG: DUF2336 domain-containing protein [Hyphomicrobiaceae bacterium]|nr:DUF2336 domain-containing protein [Hyphomicrobiaceae bacterium]
MRWLEQAPVGPRVEAASAMARAWLVSDLSDDQRECLEATMTVILDDASPLVRKALARELATAEAAPRHVIHALAYDVADVALPVLSHSTVLVDAELVDIVATGDVEVQVAIAGRPFVSQGLAAAIAEVAGPDGCVALLLNAGARVPPFSIARLADRLGHDPHVREALLGRDELPLEIRQILIAKLSEALQGFVTAKAWMGEARAYSATREACDKATVALSVETTQAQVRRLVVHLRATGQLTTGLLLRAMCCGNLRFFEEAVAVLSGLPADRVYAIIADGRGHGLKALLERAGLPTRSIPAFRLAIETHRELALDGLAGDGARLSRRMLERLLTRYQVFAESELDDLMAMLRRFSAEAARDLARDYAAQSVAA